MSLRSALGAASWKDCAAVADGELVAFGVGGTAGAGGVAYAGTRMLLALAFPGEQNVPIEGESFGRSDWVFDRALGGDGSSVWCGSGVAGFESTACGCAKEWRADDGGRGLAGCRGRWSCCRRVLSFVAAGGRGAICPEPDEAGGDRH